MKNNNATIKSSTSTIVKINLCFLQAGTFSFIAWWCWPIRPFDFGWGLLAFLSVLIAIFSIISVIKDMTKLYQREKTIQAYLQQGAQPKSSSVVSEEALKKAGMLL